MYSLPSSLSHSIHNAQTTNIELRCLALVYAIDLFTSGSIHTPDAKICTALSIAC